MGRGIIRDDVTDNAGNAIQGKEVTIYIADTVTKATLYDASTGGSEIGNPVVTDEDGVFEAYADTGEYEVEIDGQIEGRYNAVDGDELADLLAIKNIGGLTTADKVTYDGESANVKLALDARVPTVATVGELPAALLNVAVGKAVDVLGRTATGDGYQGRFFRSSTDYSAEVAVDTQQGIYIDLGDGTYGVRSFGQAVDSKAEAKLAWFGVKYDGSTETAELTAAFTTCNALDIPLSGAAGTVVYDSTVSIVRPANDRIGFKFRGAGRERTKFKPTSGAIGTAMSLTVTSGFSLNNDLSGFGIDMTDPSGTPVGLNIGPGVWRSNFDSIFLTRGTASDPNFRTGAGIYMGTATPGAQGNYDNKFTRLYVSNFDLNTHFQGTDLSGNTITNTAVDHSYIGGGNTNLKAQYFNGLSMNNTQLEAHVNRGADLVGGDSAIFIGGSIESPEAGAQGIVLDSLTKSVIALVDFFNNPGGNFIGNGKVGSFYKTTSGGLIFPAGAQITIDSDGVDNSKIRFFRNGVTDVALRVANGGNAVSLVDNATGTEKFKFDVTNDILDVLSDGKIRIQNNGEINFLQSGVTVKFLIGAGSPEGVVTASPGSLYLNRSGGAGTAMYVKESGAGDTGWVAK